MSKLFNVKGVCELALQNVGEFNQHDQGADPDSLRRTLDHFELLAAELFGTTENLWTQEEAALITIPADPNPFDFVAAAGVGVIDPNRFQIAKEVNLKETVTGRETPLALLSRSEWMAITNKALTGRPDSVFIDRQELNPLAYFSPNIAVTGYEMGVTWYAMSPTYAVTGATEFPAAWQRYVALRLARDIGSGPVVTLGNDRLQDLDTRIKAAKYVLDGFHLRETKTLRRVKVKAF